MKRPRVPALLLLFAVLASCGNRSLRDPSCGDPSRGDLPPDTPAQGVGRAVRAEQSVGAEDGQGGHEIYGMTVTEGPAFEAVPGDGSEEIDLTGLSRAALFVKVGDMNSHPESYTGRTVRMAGYFTAEQTKYGIRYTCSVPDMAGCCFESVEIRCSGDPGQPDFPADGAVVTVSGRFGFDQVDEYMRYTFLADAVIADPPAADP